MIAAVAAVTAAAGDSLAAAARVAAQLDLVDLVCHAGLVVVVMALGFAAIDTLFRRPRHGRRG